MADIVLSFASIHDPNSSDVGKFYIAAWSMSTSIGIGCYGPKNNSAGTITNQGSATKTRQLIDKKLKKDYSQCSVAEIPQRALENLKTNILTALKLPADTKCEFTQDQMIVRDGQTGAHTTPRPQGAPKPKRATMLDIQVWI